MTTQSVNVVQAEITRFLTDATADSLAIIGDWGNGKTHAWAEAVTQVQKDAKLARPGYAYVSLFGIRSIAELNVAIFRETSYEKSEKRSATIGKIGRLAYRLRKLPGFKAYADAAEDMIAFEVRDRIICFDDLERMPASLGLKEVMGLASFLKERRNCKIAFILHLDQLGNRDEFDALVEKVVDITLRFDRSAVDAAAIAIPDQSEIASQTRARCASLGIKNIRVIRQIWRLVRSIESHLADYRPSLMKQAIQSIALFSWVKLQPAIAPNEAFVMHRRGDISSQLGGSRDTRNTEEVRWDALLDEYEFARADEFDAVIASGVSAGYFSGEKLSVEADRKQALELSEEAGSSVTEAWDKFHRSFEYSDDEVAAAIFSAVTKHAKYVSPLNLDGTVRMLKELDHPNEAAELIATYVGLRSPSASELDLDDYVFSGDVKDPDVIAAFSARRSEFVDARDPLAVLVEGARHGFSRADALLLNKLSVSALVTIIKRAGNDIPRVVKACLSPATSGAHGAALATSARKALISLGQESKASRLRVKRFGITDEELDL